MPIRLTSTTWSGESSGTSGIAGIQAEVPASRPGHTNRIAGTRWRRRRGAATSSVEAYPSSMVTRTERVGSGPVSSASRPTGRKYPVRNRSCRSRSSGRTNRENGSRSASRAPKAWYMRTSGRRRAMGGRVYRPAGPGAALLSCGSGRSSRLRARIVLAEEGLHRRVRRLGAEVVVEQAIVVALKVALHQVPLVVPEHVGHVREVRSHVGERPVQVVPLLLVGHSEVPVLLSADVLVRGPAELREPYGLVAVPVLDHQVVHGGHVRDQVDVVPLRVGRLGGKVGHSLVRVGGEHVEGALRPR